MTDTVDVFKRLQEKSTSKASARCVINKFKILGAFIVGAGLGSLLLSYNFIEFETGSKGIGSLHFLQEREKVDRSQQSHFKGGIKNMRNTDFKENNSRVGPRILCWVMTGPRNHEIKAMHVKKTWGSRCDKLIFMSSLNNTELGVVGLPNVKEGRGWLWAKTKEAFRYVWENHREEADWFLKADDDTFVVLENLRFILSKYKPTEPVYFGCHFKPVDKEHKNGYMSGGAGYVLSKETLRKFTDIPDDHKCLSAVPNGSEDVEMGKCLEEIGIKAGDSRDKFGRYRFLPFTPSHHLIPPGDPNSWYWSYIVHPNTMGEECCSNLAISFHYIKPAAMYLLEYLIYRLKPLRFPPKSVFYSPYKREQQQRTKKQTTFITSTTTSIVTEKH